MAWALSYGRCGQAFEIESNIFLDGFLVQIKSLLERLGLLISI